MADQDSQPQNQQTGQSAPDITGNRTRKENTQETTSAKTDQDAEQAADNMRPKFQSKHKDRSVQPPEAPGASAENASNGGEPAAQESQQPVSSAQNQTDAAQQTSQLEPTSGTSQEQSAGAGAQSSKLNGAQTSSEGSGSGDDGSVLPPESHLNSLDGKEQNKQPKSSKGKKKWFITTGVLVLLLALGLGGYGAYAQYVLPQEAPKSYMERLSNMKSGQYQVNVTSQHQVNLTSLEDNQVNMDVTSEGQFSTDPENPQDSTFNGSVDVSVGGGGFNINIESDLRFVDGTGYARLNNAQVLQAFLPGLESGAWYSWDASDASNGGSMAVPTDLSSTECTQEDMQALRDYFDNGASGKISLNDTQRHTWIGEQRDGNRVQHYSGEITGSSVKSMVQGAVEATSQECLSSESVNIANLDQYVLEYDLYTGDDWDEVVVRVMQNGSKKATITLTTSDYNQETDVTAPEDATPIQNLLQNGLGDQGSGLYSDANGFGSTPDGFNQESGFDSGSGSFQPGSVRQRN